MKKLCLLSGMMIFVAVINLNASLPAIKKYPGGITEEQRQQIESAQWGKVERQRELARPAIYKMIDSLFSGTMRTYVEIDWPAIFAVLDSMQGVIDVNEYDFDGETLLIKAIMGRKLLVAKTLLEKYNADPNKLEITKISGWSNKRPLMYACIQNDLPMVKLLLQYGANPDLKDTNGNDCFYYARSKRDILNVLNKLNVFNQFNRFVLEKG